MIRSRSVYGNIRIACVGLENQTESDPDAPLRVIGYDGAEYRAQLLRDHNIKMRLDGEAGDAGEPVGRGFDNIGDDRTPDVRSDDDSEILAEPRHARTRYPVVTLVLYYGYERRCVASGH